MEGCELNMHVLSALPYHRGGMLPFSVVSAYLHACTCVYVCAHVCVSQPGMSHISRGHLPRFSAVTLIFNTCSPHLLSLAEDTLLCLSLTESSPTFTGSLFSCTLAFTSDMSPSLLLLCASVWSPSPLSIIFTASPSFFFFYHPFFIATSTPILLMLSRINCFP